jgi:hypothetical protein
MTQARRIPPKRHRLTMKEEQEPGLYRDPQVYPWVCKTMLGQLL